MSVAWRSRSDPVNGMLTGACVCTIILPSGDACGRPSDATAPFPICNQHLVDAYRHVTVLLSRQIVINPPPHRVKGNGKSMIGWGMNGWSSVVYYAQIGDHIKIGHTKNIVQRMKWYPPSARLLALEPGAKVVESERHRQFKHLLSARSEWFDPGPDLMTHIEQLACEGLRPGPRDHLPKILSASFAPML